MSFSSADLARAVFSEDTYSVERMLRLGGDANATVDGHTLLQMAIDSNNVDIVHMLLNHGADKDKKDPEGFAPLHHACRKGYASVVRMLLCHGAKDDVCGSFGWTPLSLAVFFGHTDIVKILLLARGRPAPSYIVTEDLFYKIFPKTQVVC